MNSSPAVPPIVPPASRGWGGYLREKLGRVTSSGNFIPEIDGFRFIALAWVLAFHINGEFAKEQGAHFSGQLGGGWAAVIGSWHFGVQLFFVISGFILGLPFYRSFRPSGKPLRLRDYYVRRLTRIEPPLIINLCVFAVLLHWVKAAPWPELGPHFFASLGSLHNFIYHEPSHINFVTWSLEIEAQFYLLAPFLAWLFRFRSTAAILAVLVAVMVGTVLLNGVVAQQNSWLRLTLLGQLPYFLAGFVLVVWYETGRAAVSTPRGHVWDGIALVAWIVLQELLFRESQLPAQLLLPFAVVLGYVALFRGRWANFLITRPVFTIVGGMCYTVYLYHPFLKSALKHVFFRLSLTDVFWVNSLLQILLLGGVIVAVSAGLFLLFEKPFMHSRWPQKVWMRLRGEKQPAAKTPG